MRRASTLTVTDRNGHVERTVVVEGEGMGDVALKRIPIWQRLHAEHPNSYIFSSWDGVPRHD